MMNRYNTQDKKEYLDVCSKLRVCRENMEVEGIKNAFIHLSIRAHALRGKVPKSWYSMANE